MLVSSIKQKFATYILLMYNKIKGNANLCP